MPGSAVLLTGFNNWGKSRLIYDLFGRRRFEFGRTYRIANVNADFVVESHSNDDYSEATFIAQLDHRLRQSSAPNANLFSAFCPTREPQNDALRILGHTIFRRFSAVTLFLLAFKWDHHACLLIPDLQSYFGAGGAQIFVVDADASVSGDVARFTARRQQVLTELRRVFP